MYDIISVFAILFPLMAVTYSSDGLVENQGKLLYELPTSSDMYRTTYMFSKEVSHPDYKKKNRVYLSFWKDRMGEDYEVLADELLTSIQVRMEEGESYYQSIQLNIYQLFHKKEVDFEKCPEISSLLLTTLIDTQPLEWGIAAEMYLKIQGALDEDVRVVLLKTINEGLVELEEEMSRDLIRVNGEYDRGEIDENLYSYVSGLHTYKRNHAQEMLSILEGM